MVQKTIAVTATDEVLYCLLVEMHDIEECFLTVDHGGCMTGFRKKQKIH